jgi:hypothetical protein
MPRGVKEAYPEGWREQYNKIYWLARKLGVRLVKRVAADSAQWNGRSIALYGFAGCRLTPSELLHEIAHWLCASPTRRRLHDYGLGGGNYSNVAVRRTAGVEDDESAASLLGILYERAIGMDWELTWEEHNWGRSDLRARAWDSFDELDWEGNLDFWPTLALLLKRKLVSPTGRPKGTKLLPCV